MLRDNDTQLAKVAVAPNNTSGAITGTKVNADSYGRARFIFTFGGTAGVGSFVSAGIWKGATSGATFTSISSAVLAGVSSGILSAAAQVMIIDVATDPDKPWLLVSGGLNSAATLLNSCVVELYDGITRPPTHTEQQIVTV